MKSEFNPAAAAGGQPACDHKDVAIKSFFLGPQGENGPWFEGLVSELLGRWLQWRRELYPEDGSAIARHDQSDQIFQDRQSRFRSKALELSRRFEGEIPKFSPRYMGHMFSEISLPALIGHWIATLHNPNNISSESAPVGVEVEKEAIAELLKMSGFSKEGIGHFTSCGSIANFEAVLRARDRIALWLSAELKARSLNSANSLKLFEAAHMGWKRLDEKVPSGVQRLDPLPLALEVHRSMGAEYSGPLLLVPENRHYSWVKSAHLLGLGLQNIVPMQLDQHGTLKPSVLNQAIEWAARNQKPIAMVVSVLGTTELGNFDPVHEVNEILDRYRQSEGWDLWHHVDAAYGGFFLSLKETAPREQGGYFDERARRAVLATGSATSLTIDPHKLGYVPFSCGAFLCNERRDYVTQDFHSPYIQYNKDWEPGPHTIEGSRSASGAAATWLTLKTIGGDPEGYGRIIGRTIQLRQELAARLKQIDASVRVLPEQDSNVLCFTVGKKDESLKKANEWVERFYKSHSGPRAPFFVSKTALKLSSYEDFVKEFFAAWDPQVDTGELQLVRLTLMNPFLKSKEMRFKVFDEFCLEVKNAL